MAQFAENIQKRKICIPLVSEASEAGTKRRHFFFFQRGIFLLFIFTYSGNVGQKKKPSRRRHLRLNDEAHVWP